MTAVVVVVVMVAIVEVIVVMEEMVKFVGLRQVEGTAANQATHFSRTKNRRLSRRI